MTMAILHALADSSHDHHYHHVTPVSVHCRRTLSEKELTKARYEWQVSEQCSILHLYHLRGMRGKPSSWMALRMTQEIICIPF